MVIQLSKDFLNDGFEVNGCSDCAVNVSHIETQDAAGIYFSTGLLNTHSTLTMTHSDIRTKPGSSYAGVELWGSQGDFSFVIEKSKFHSEDPCQLASIDPRE